MKKKLIDLSQKKVLHGIILKMGLRQETLILIHYGLTIILFQTMELIKMYYKLNKILRNTKRSSDMNWNQKNQEKHGKFQWKMMKHILMETEREFSLLQNLNLITDHELLRVLHGIISMMVRKKETLNVILLGLITIMSLTLELIKKYFLLKRVLRKLKQKWAKKWSQYTTRKRDHGMSNWNLTINTIIIIVKEYFI
jgi:hypothetical protein